MTFFVNFCVVSSLQSDMKELILRKDKSCFMCRESLKLTKLNCDKELEKTKADYEDRLHDLGQLLNQKNLEHKSGKHFIICERNEYDDLHDRLRETCTQLQKLKNEPNIVEKVTVVEKPLEIEKLRFVSDPNNDRKVKSLKRKNFRLKEEILNISQHVYNLEELLSVMKTQKEHYLEILGAHSLDTQLF